MPLSSPAGTRVSISGVYQETLIIDPDLLDLAEGELVYGSATGTETLAAGDPDQVLRMLGTIPGWDDEAAGGGTSEIGTYRPLLRHSGRYTASAVAATKYFYSGITNEVSAPSLTGTNTPAVLIMGLAAADYAVAGKSLKLRIKAMMLSAADPAVTVTAGLYPVSVSGTTAVLGTLVTGSGAALTAAGANAITVNTGADFDFPADGTYAPGYVVSGTPANAGSLQVVVQIVNV